MAPIPAATTVNLTFSSFQGWVLVGYGGTTMRRAARNCLSQGENEEENPVRACYLSWGPKERGKKLFTYHLCWIIPEIREIKRGSQVSRPAYANPGRFTLERGLCVSLSYHRGEQWTQQNDHSNTEHKAHHLQVGLVSSSSAYGERVLRRFT